MRKICSFTISLLLFFFVFSFSQIPQQMSYQGYLTDNAGNPVTGNHKLTFTLYDAQSGGNTLWMEEHPTVAINQGVFRVQLGSREPLNLAFDDPYWLSIKVDDNPELAPRIALSSVGYSFNSMTAESVADGSISTGSIQDGAVTLAKIEPDMMVKIYEGSVSGVSSHEVTGLDGNLHKYYKIFFNGRLHLADTYLLVRPNRDDTNGNYRTLMNYNGDASGWQWFATGMFLGRSAWGECDVSYELTLFCESNRNRFSHGEGIAGLLTNYHILTFDAWSRWINTTDNVTSIEITSTNATGLTTGTFSGQITIYAIVPR